MDKLTSVENEEKIIYFISLHMTNIELKTHKTHPLIPLTINATVMDFSGLYRLQ